MNTLLKEWTVGNSGSSYWKPLNAVVENATKTTVQITFDKEISEPLPDVSAFSFVFQPKSITNIQIDATKKILTLTVSVAFIYDSLIVCYNKPELNPLRTTTGKEAQSFKIPVVNNVTPTAAYTFPESTGNRTGLISITDTGNVFSIGTSAKLIDGTLGNDLVFASALVADKYIRFDFGTPKVITEANLLTQRYNYSMGTWIWQGSNDGNTWENIGSSFNLLTSSQWEFKYQTQLNGNTSFYRYYQLLGVSGSSAVGTYIYEMEFKILGASQDNIYSWVDRGTNIWLTKTGTGTALGKLTLKSNTNTVVNIIGNARFYDDVNGTIGQSLSCSIVAEVEKIVYVKCGYGSILQILSNSLTQFIWESEPSTNRPSIGGDIVLLNALTTLNLAGSNTIYGDISTFIHLVLLSTQQTSGITGDITNMVDLVSLHRGKNNTGVVTGDISNAIGITGMSLYHIPDEIVGDISNMIGLTYIVTDCGALSGDITNLVNIKQAYIKGLATCTGDISNFVLDCSVNPNNGFEVTAYTELSGNADNINVRIFNILGTGTITGDGALLTNAWYIATRSAIYTMTRAINVPSLSVIYLPNVAMTSENINQLLADMWANKDQAKPFLLREITLKGTATGQGLIDKAALEAYRSPNNDPAKPLWTITITP